MAAASRFVQVSNEFLDNLLDTSILYNTNKSNEVWNEDIKWQVNFVFTRRNCEHLTWFRFKSP